MKGKKADLIKEDNRYNIQDLQTDRHDFGMYIKVLPKTKQKPGGNSRCTGSC